MFKKMLLGLFVASFLLGSGFLGFDQNSDHQMQTAKGPTIQMTPGDGSIGD